MTAVYDAHNRPLQDLRISVTDRCNFRCNYCMPAELFPDNFQFLGREHLLSFEEITRLTKIFLSFGVRKVRLTGGEPLLRKDLPVLIKQITSLDGVDDIGLTTNGLLLGRHAKALKEAGLQRVNVSLDALDSSIFAKMNGRNIGIEPILKSIKEAQEAGLLVKINTVIKKGLNESQILPMARYCKKNGIQLRYIEFMDVGCSNGWKLDEVITSKEIRDMIHEEMPLEEGTDHYFGEVAKRYRYLDGQGEVGFISSVTETFCSSCTRARISADGKLYTCLFAGNGYDIRSLLRSEATDEEVKTYISDVWSRRTERYSDERHENMKNNKKRDKIEMSYIGG